MIDVLGRFEPGVIATAVALALVWLVVLQVLCVLQWLKLRRVFRGSAGRDLESLIAEHGAALDAIRRRELDTKDALTRIRQHLERSISQVNMVKFNPYGAGGAEQSFSIALLDSTGSGVVISCLQSGDGGSRIYGKPIEQKTSQHRLSPEEEKAIAGAMKSQ